MLKSVFGRALGALALTAATLGAQAQQWPDRPIRWLNPFPAGGGTDAFARPMSQKLSQLLGQNVIIENLAGAGGTVGAGVAANQAADGYAWFVGAVHHTIAETLYSKLPYDGLEKNFEPVTVLAYVPNVVVVHPKHDFATLKGLIDYAKKNPGKLNFGSAGNGTTHHLVGELFKLQTKVDLVHVPYKGAGPLMADLLAGVVDLAFDGMGTSGPQIKGGRLKALAVSSPQRNALIPEVPTMAEAGVGGIKVTTWYGVWAVKGTPKPIIDKMYGAIAQVLKDPAIKKVWDSQGADLGGIPPAEMTRFVRSEIENWGRVVKASGAKIDN